MSQQNKWYFHNFLRRMVKRDKKVNKYLHLGTEGAVGGLPEKFGWIAEHV
jgi:hypothetical protein